MAKIIVSVDHKWRDLPAYVYLSELLKKDNHEVLLVRNGFEKYYVVGFKPEMILMTHLYEKSKQQFAKELSEQGIIVMLLPTEGIPTLERARKFASGFNNDLSGVDLHFLWNRPMFDLLSKNETIKKDSLRVVGCPRFDFYRNPLNKTIIEKNKFCEKFNLDKKLPIITFATNFTQSQFHNNTDKANFLKKDAKRLGYENTIKAITGSLEDMARRDYESREILLKAFCQLLNDFPAVNFILKLHPSEDHLYYLNLEKKLKDKYGGRVIVISSGYIWDLLKVTDIELQRSCTTAIESWMTGKPTIEMKLNPDEWYFSPEHAAGSSVATNYEQLKSYVVKYLADSSITPELHHARNEFIEKWCYKVDGKRTFSLAEEINNYYKTNKKNIRIKFNIKYYLIYLVLKYSNYKIHDLRVYGVLSIFKQNKVDKLGRIDKYFKKDDVNFWRKKIQAIL